MQLTQTLSPRLQLRQILAPKLIHMLQTFQVPYAELVDQINTESQDNVFLDVIRYDQLTEYAAARKSSETSSRDISDYTADIAPDKGSLYDFLLSQLDLTYLRDKEYQIAKLLIEQIDERGYMQNYAEISAKIQTQIGVKERKVHDVLKVIQTFEPDGVGARTLKECLLIQIEETGFETEALRDILRKAVTHHLDPLADRRFKSVAAKLGIPEEGAVFIADYIKTNLNPNPGAGFAASQINQHMIPSFEAIVIDDKISLTNLEKTSGLQIGLSPKYIDYLKDPNLDAATRQFLEEKQKKARELVENFYKRLECLDNMALLITRHQEAFIKKGPAYLRPLLQKEIAENLHLSSSTISRIVSSKYIQTPHGTYAFKTLCPRNHFGKTKEQIKTIIRDVVADHPTYSDEKIGEALKSTHDLTIARRTIAKYRQAAGITTSYSRSRKLSDNEV